MIEALFVQNPGLGYAIGLLIILGVVLFLDDRRRTNQRRRLSINLYERFKQSAHHRFSVICQVHSADDAHTILDELVLQQYPNIELILVADRADQPLHRSLRRIRSQRAGDIPIRLVKLRQGTASSVQGSKYATGDALLHVHPHDTLTHEFLYRVSVELLHPAVSVVDVQLIPRVTDSLSSAVAALSIIARQTIAPTFARLRCVTRVDRRLGTTSESSTIYATHSRVISSLPASPLRIPTIEIALSVMAAIVPFIALQSVPLASTLVFVAAFVAFYFVVLLLKVISSDYSRMTKLSLIALAPVWPLAAIATSLLVAARASAGHAVTKLRPARVN